MEATRASDDLIDHTTAAALAEKKKLRKSFTRFDIFFFLLCTLISLDTVGAVSANGAQAFTWIIFMGLFLFLPYGLIMSELGTAFPEEGGPYVWTRLAFGRFPAAVNAVLYWIANPVWVGGTLTVTAMAAVNAFFLTKPMHGPPQYLFGLAFIWAVITATVLSFRIGKWIPNIGGFLRVIILGFFMVSVIIYGIRHGVHGFGGHAFLPTYAVFIALAPLLFFNYTGFEVPSAAGEEMINPQRDVPYSIARTFGLTMLFFAGPILGVLLVLPPGQATGLGGFMDAAKAVFTIYGGHVAADGTATLTGAGLVLGKIAAIGAVLVVLTAGTSWLIGGDRAQAVAGYDGAGPRVLGYFSRRFGTPVVVNVLSGVVASVMLVMVLTITSGNTAKYFSAVLGLVLSLTVLSYILIFPALIKLRYSYPHVPRPFRIPGGNAVAWVVGGLATFWAVFGSVVILWPGLGVNWFGQKGDPDASLPAGFTRLQFELTQFIPLALIVLLGVTFYLLGRKTRAQMVQIPFTEEVALAQPAAAGGALVRDDGAG
jgi:glutamate:GABA antiporter